jgi:cytoplasmic iron level regulating protein YaaA (DUF328/UPF0246 family)
LEILINSSKTMVSQPQPGLRKPALLAKARILADLIKGFDQAELRAMMHISEKLAVETEALLKGWSAAPRKQTLAIDAFQGDIYRGLKAQSLSESDRDWADEHLRILSGLYGMVRPYDGISPYRLELEYKLSGEGFANLYDFWGDAIAKKLAKRGWIVNLASQEYFRAIGPFVKAERVIEPVFLSQMKAGKEPEFVAVHAKVARGAFARWLIQHRIDDPAEFPGFDGHDYACAPESSTPTRPVFIKKLGGMP